MVHFQQCAGSLQAQLIALSETADSLNLILYNIQSNNNAMRKNYSKISSFRTRTLTATTTRFHHHDVVTSLRSQFFSLFKYTVFTLHSQILPSFYSLLNRIFILLQNIYLLVVKSQDLSIPT